MASPSKAGVQGPSLAAAVAAAAAPNVGTGGLVAEVDPPPDFSQWSVLDDIRLRRAMEVTPPLVNPCLLCVPGCYRAGASIMSQ